MPYAYTAKPADADPDSPYLPPDYRPPGWDPAWPFPGPYPPGYDPEYLMHITGYIDEEFWNTTFWDMRDAEGVLVTIRDNATEDILKQGYTDASGNFDLFFDLGTASRRCDILYESANLINESETRFLAARDRELSDRSMAAAVLLDGNAFGRFYDDPDWKFTRIVSAVIVKHIVTGNEYDRAGGSSAFSFKWPARDFQGTFYVIDIIGPAPMFDGTAGTVEVAHEKDGENTGPVFSFGSASGVGPPDDLTQDIYRLED